MAWPRICVLLGAVDKFAPRLGARRAVSSGRERTVVIVVIGGNWCCGRYSSSRSRTWQRGFDEREREPSVSQRRGYAHEGIRRRSSGQYPDPADASGAGYRRHEMAGRTLSAKANRRLWG